MADDDRKLPDLVSRVRTVYDGSGVEAAKKDAQGLGDELDKAANGEGFQQASNSIAEAREQLGSWKDALNTADVDDPAAMQSLKEGVAGWQVELDRRTGLASSSLDDVGEAGLLAGGKVSAGMAGAAAAAAGAAVAAKMALDAFNQAGAEGRLEGEQLEQYRELRNATDDLKDSLNELAVEGGALVASLVEPLVAVADGILEIANSDPLGTGESLAAGFFKAVNPLAQVGDLLDAIGVGGDAAGESQAELEARAEAVAKAFEHEQKEAAATARALDDLADAQLDAAKAAESLQERQENLSGAQTALAAAEAKVDDLRRSGGRSSEEAIAASERLATAQDRLADAHRRVRDSELDIVDARRELQQAQVEQGVQSEEALKAARDLDDANLDAADARKGVGDATAEVGEARRDVAAAATKALADAERDLAARHEALEDAAFNLADAEVAHAQAQAEANGQVFNAQDAARIYKDSLGELADDLGGRVGQRLDAFAASVRSVNEAMAAIVANVDTIGPLLGMDFASGAAIAPTVPVTSSPAAAPSSPAPTGGSANVRAAGAETVVYRQDIQITVPSSAEVAAQLDHDLQWLAGR